MSENTNSGPTIRSPEKPSTYTRITRDPNTPVQFQGEAEPRKHSVFLSFEPPQFHGQSLDLKGRCVIELTADESKLTDYYYHSVYVLESLPDGTGNRLDQQLVETYKRNKIFYILTRNIELTEEEKSKLDHKVKKAKPQPKEFNRDAWFKNHPEVTADEEWFNREEENIKAGKRIS